MKNDELKVEIKSGPSDTAEFVVAARSNADREREALGFFPAPVYDDAANRGDLLIALVATGGIKEYAGHVLFGGTFPHARIFQMLVSAKFRKLGIGTSLIAHLKQVLERSEYLSISARVAEDLEINAFWDKVGFRLVRQTPGGATRNRTINVRIRELDSPTLFSPRQLVASTDLGLIGRIGTQQSVYVIDLNVFWDVAQRRPRAQSASQVIGAAFNKWVTIVVAEEFTNELQRSSKLDSPDPVLEFAMQFPILREPNAAVLPPLLDELARLIFPARLSGGALSPHERSDLIHLATAIHHDATGFVTSDEALLCARDSLYSRYGIDLLSVDNFAAMLHSSQQSIPTKSAHLSSGTLEISEISNNDTDTIRVFVESFRTPPAFREDFLATGIMAGMRKRLKATSEADTICLASWDTGSGLQESTRVHVVANEDHPAVETALDGIFGRVCSATSRVAPVALSLRILPGHAMTRKVAFLQGFRSSEGSKTEDEFLHKICVGQPVYTENWSKIRAVLRYRSGLCFQDSLPTFTAHDQAISFTTASGEQRSVKLNDLENLLSPTLLILPGRSGRIVPIRRYYAEHLLGSSAQMSLLPGREAGLLSKRVYFSAALNAALLVAGVPLLFYESTRGGGSACVTACARVVETKVLRKSEVPGYLWRHGVLEEDDLKESVAVTTFENVMSLDRPMPLERLRELGCADASNFVCTKHITYDHLVSVLKEGFTRGQN